MWCRARPPCAGRWPVWTAMSWTSRSVPGSATTPVLETPVPETLGGRRSRWMARPCGARSGAPAAPGVHLLSALTHQHGTVMGQRLVPIGDSEIAEFDPLLAGLELAEKVVT